jgi:orotidine-5'-phosphate decarboxylase
MEREQALMLAWNLSPYVWGFKVNDLLVSYGLDIVRDLKFLGKVFADPKLYDIPKTVANGVYKLAEAGADLITVHVSGGRQMIKAAMDNAGDAKIIGVTALTSLDDPQIQEVYHRTAEETVWDLAHLAYDCKLDGIVCSSREVEMLKHLNFIKVVPGIRLGRIEGDDQKRTGNGAGADYFVIGRPITEAMDPIEALNQLVRGENNASNN